MEDIQVGERLTFHPERMNFDDNRHFEVIVGGFTKTGLVRIAGKRMSEAGVAEDFKATVSKKRLSRQLLIEA